MIKDIRKRVERKPLDLKRVVALLSQLKENPEQYRKIIIRVDFVGKLMFVKDNYNLIDYEGDDVIRKHRDEIWSTIILLLMGAECDTGYCNEDDSAVSLCFHNGSDSGNRRFIYIVCFKD